MGQLWEHGKRIFMSKTSLAMFTYAKFLQCYSSDKTCPVDMMWVYKHHVFERIKNFEMSELSDFMETAAIEETFPM